MQNLEEKVEDSLLKRAGCFLGGKVALGLLAGVVLGYSPNVSAEVIYLTNGKQIEGKIISQDEKILKVKTDFGEVLILNENIRKVEYSPTHSPPLQTPPKEETPAPKKDLSKMKYQPLDSEEKPEPKNYKSEGFGLNIGAFLPSGERFDKIYGTSIVGGFDFVNAVNQWFSTEFDLSAYYASGEPETYAFGGIDPESVKGDCKLWILMLGMEGRLTFSSGAPVIPYLSFGADFWYLKETLNMTEPIQDSKSGSFNGLGAHVGGGLEFIASEKLAVPIRIKYTYIPAETYNPAEGDLANKEKTNLGGVMITIGIRSP
mgnify:CR=1 FL=1